MLLLALAPLLFDWPRFQGPNGDQSADWPAERFEWPAGGPEVAWRVALGEGFGGAAIEGGEVFVLDRDSAAERDVLRVFALADGAERWSAGYAAPGRLSYRGSRTVPTVVGRHVYTTGGLGHATCFDRETRASVWHVDLEARFGGEQPMFGWSTHPVVVGDLVIVAPLGKEVSLVALDRLTGEERWRTGFLGYSHATPVLATVLGREVLVMNTCPEPASGQDAALTAWVIALDPKTGELVWRHETVLCRLPVTSPFSLDSAHLFVTGGYRAGSKLLYFEDVEGKVKVTERFQSTRGAQIHGPVRLGEHLYLLANENWNENRRRRAEGGLMCIDLTGRELWRTGDAPYFGRGGCVRLGDALIVQDGYDGTLRAVRLGPERYNELGSFAPFREVRGDGQMWAPPAASGTRLVIRSQSELVAVELAPQRGE